MLVGGNGAGKSTFFRLVLEPLGYQIIMVLIHLETAALNQARIASRISSAGGCSAHPRQPSALNPFLPVLTISNGRVEKHLDPLPAWAAELVLDHPLAGQG